MLPYHPKLIKNIGPEGAKLLILGRFPSQKDWKAGFAFQAGTAMLLREAMKEAGFDLASTRRMSLVPYLPPLGKIDKWLVPMKEVPKEYRHILGPVSGAKYLSPEILPWIAELQDYIKTHQPNVILSLGGELSRILVGNEKVTQTRGALHDCQLVPGVKVIPTYHPASCFKNYSLQPIFKADVQKAVRESAYPERRLLSRRIHVPESVQDILDFHAQYGADATACTVDIETVPSRKQIVDIGIAYSRTEALVIPILNKHKPDYHHWSFKDELAIWRFLRHSVLEAEVNIYGQNYVYDATWLYDLLGIKSMNYTGDSLVLHHALFPEVSKDLGFLSSIYCDEVAWKQLASFKKQKATP